MFVHVPAWGSAAIRASLKELFPWSPSSLAPSLCVQVAVAGDCPLQRLQCKDVGSNSCFRPGLWAVRILETPLKTHSSPKARQGAWNPWLATLDPSCSKTTTILFLNCPQLKERFTNPESAEKTHEASSHREVTKQHLTVLRCSVFVKILQQSTQKHFMTFGALFRNGRPNSCIVLEKAS